MTFRNPKNGLELCVELLPGQKKLSLLIGDELGYKKVASFINDNDADDFISHMERLTEMKGE